MTFFFFAGMVTTEEFRVLGPWHVAILVLTGVLPVVLGLLARRLGMGPGIGLVLAVVLLGNKLATLWYSWEHGRLWIGNMLPMHLCDWATLCAAAALLTRRRFLCDLTYFWGLGATVHALVTPDIGVGVPVFYVWVFFVSHSGVIVASGFLVFGCGYRPDWRSLVRAALWTQVYAASALTVNILTGSNYGYLMAKPSQPSLLDWLAPWPWYILQLEGVMVVVFLVLWSPFLLWRARREHPSARWRPGG